MADLDKIVRPFQLRPRASALPEKVLEVRKPGMPVVLRVGASGQGKPISGSGPYGRVFSGCHHASYSGGETCAQCVATPSPTISLPLCRSQDSPQFGCSPRQQISAYPLRLENPCGHTHRSKRRPSLGAVPIGCQSGLRGGLGDFNVMGP